MTPKEKLGLGAFLFSLALALAISLSPFGPTTEPCRSPFSEVFEGSEDEGDMIISEECESGGFNRLQVAALFVIGGGVAWWLSPEKGEQVKIGHDGRD